MDNDLYAKTRHGAPTSITILFCFLVACTASGNCFANPGVAQEVYETCPMEGPSVELKISKDEQGRSIARWEGEGMGYVVWEGDINDDGRLDSVIYEEDTCGKGAYCNYRVYVGCTMSNHYVLVWGPEYAQNIKVGSDGSIIEGKQWRDLVSVEQTRDGGEITQVFRFFGNSYDISLAHLYKESMRIYKRKNLSRAFSNMDWYFRNRDFKDLSQVHIPPEQYAQILNDYAYLMQLTYERTIDGICKKGANKQQRNEILEIRTKFLQRAKELLEYVVVLQPKRSVAYLNLADVLYELDMNGDAAVTYKKYLELIGGNPPRRAEEPSARIKKYKCEG